MYQRFRVVLLVVLMLCPLLASAQTASDQLAQILNGLTAMQANFDQKVLDGHGKILQETQGVMSLQRPGKFRWETQGGTNQLLVADGKRVWFYDKDLAQVTVSPQQNGNSNAPAMLLSGSTPKLIEEFDVTSLNTANPNGAYFKLAPKEKGSLFQSAELVFDHQQLQMMRLVDGLGQITEIKFAQVKTNLALSAALFRFVPPKGVDVVTN